MAKSTLISLNISNIMKLTVTNFITWRLQVRALLEAHELHCFIDDEDKSPPSTITKETNIVEPNPDHVAWNQQEKMLYSALLGSISVAVQPIVARATTAREVWQIIYRTYGKPMRGHIKQLKQQIKITKDSKSIDEYMRSIMDKADKLALLGAAYEHEDLLDIITDDGL